MTDSSNSGNSDNINVNVSIFQPTQENVLIIGSMKTKVPKLIINVKENKKEKAKKKEKDSEGKSKEISKGKTTKSTTKKVTQKINNTKTVNSVTKAKLEDSSKVKKQVTKKTVKTKEER